MTRPIGRLSHFATQVLLVDTRSPPYTSVTPKGASRRITMTRLFLASLLLLAAGCDASMGLPTDGSFDGYDADPQTGDEPADERDADVNDVAGDDTPEGDDEPVDDLAPLPDEDDLNNSRLCVFGDDVSTWSDDAGLQATTFEHVLEPGDLTDLELDQLEAGFARWDFFDFETLDELFDSLDGHRILVRDVLALDIDREFTHVRLHFRDIEFGFVFTAGLDRPVAAVEDGSVVDCGVIL